MNSDDKFWLVFNGLVAVIIICFIFAIMSYHKDRNSKIVEMIKSGIAPIEIGCAFEDGLNDDPKCIVLALKK